MTDHRVFNFDEWDGKDVVMHCKTQAEAGDFCRVMHSAGKTWKTGYTYDLFTMWEHASSYGICYNFNLGLWETIEHYLGLGFTVLEWSDYMQPSTDTAKDDANKPRLSLVPMQIVWDIADIRAYGNKKYGDPDNWKKVEPGRYWDALLRHVLSVPRDDLLKADPESGLPHLWHAATNLAFLLEMLEGDKKC